jgi:ATP-dependent helicase Lhr and Lhr-like helicase
MLLRRYGIVFRELLARETIVPKWRELLITMRRLEDRREIRGGRFVSGFLGEQFALPLAVESLRATRNLTKTGDTVPVSAADPLDLVGIIVPGDCVAANSGRTVAFRDGVAVPRSEHPDVTVLAASRTAAQSSKFRGYAATLVISKVAPEVSSASILVLARLAFFCRL